MTNPTFPLVVFDLDGTIADTAPDLAAALNAALVSLGRPAQTLDAVHGMIGHGTRALLRNRLAATAAAIRRWWRRRTRCSCPNYEAHICDHSAPYPGVEQAWDDLALQGVRLALCTNKPAAPTDKLLAALGWQERFVAVVGGDTLAVSKPDPAPLHLAIAQAGGGPAAFVGDSSVDIQTAKAAGIPSIAVSFGFADRPAHKLGANGVIDHYAELVATLATLQG